MILENITRLLPRLMFAFLYVVTVAFLLSWFSSDGLLTLKYVVYHPVNTVKYLYHYMKWWYGNREALGLIKTLEVFSAFILPYVLFFLLRALSKLTSRVLSVELKRCFKWFCRLLHRNASASKKKPSNKQKTRAAEHQANTAQIKRDMMRAAEIKIDDYLEKKLHTKK